MWLDFTRLLRCEPSYREAVLQSPAEQILKQRQFLLLRRYDHLAANIMLDAMLKAELNHRSTALAGKSGLEAARFIVNAGVYHATVASTLVRCKVGLFLEKNDARVRISPCQSHCSRQTYDAASDYCIVKHIALYPFLTRSQ